jgi:hypothetical protein
MAFKIVQSGCLINKLKYIKTIKIKKWLPRKYETATLQFIEYKVMLYYLITTNL